MVKLKGELHRKNSGGGVWDGLRRTTGAFGTSRERGLVHKSKSQLGSLVVTVSPHVSPKGPVVVAIKHRNKNGERGWVQITFKRTTSITLSNRAE